MYFIKAREMKTEWWRYFVTMLPVLFAYFILGGIPLYIVIFANQMHGIPMDLENFSKTTDPADLGLSQNAGLLILLLPAVLGFFVLWFSIIKIHHTTTGNIASYEGKIRWGRFFRAAFLWLLFLIIAELIFAVIAPENYTYQFDLQKFLPLVVIAVLFIPFQTWFEELFFRAYMLQGIGLLFRSRIIALILTSVGFGLLHSFNPEVSEFGFWSTMPYYIGFGLFAGLLVVYDNGIEMACGIHAVNNVYSAILVTYNGSVLKTPALWSIQKIDPWAMNLGFLLMAVLFFIIMARRYNWGDWNKLFRFIPRSELKQTN